MNAIEETWTPRPKTREEWRKFDRWRIPRFLAYAPASTNAIAQWLHVGWHTATRYLRTLQRQGKVRLTRTRANNATVWSAAGGELE